MLHQTLLLARGESIYKPLDTYPYIFSNYPPLFQSLASPLAALWGASFAPGRLLAMAATLGLGLVLYKLVRRAGAWRLPALAASLLFWGSPYIYHWAPLFRIDLPALFLSTLGVLVVWSATMPVVALVRPQASSHSRTHSTHRLYLAALLFVLALYTKQSYVAAPAATAIYLFLNDRPAALRLMAALLTLGLAPFVVLQALTHGSFAFGLFTANVNPFSLSLLLSQTRAFVATFAGVIILAVIGAASRIQDASPRLPVSLLGWYGLAAVATIALAGKVGAWENYFFEALAMLCVFAGVGIDRLARSQRAVVQLALPGLLIVQLALMWHDPRIGQRVVDEDGAANRTLAPIIAQTPGMILSEDLGLLLVNGKKIPYFSFQYAQLASVGRWDERWETDSLRAGRFDLVVLERGTREAPEKFGRFTRTVLSALDAGYGLSADVGKYRLYTPAPLQRQLDVVFGDQAALLGYRLDRAPGDLALFTAASLPAWNPWPLATTYPERLRVTLLWQARRQMGASYKVFVHLEDETGARRAQADAVPLSGVYPTSRWSVGETVRDYLDLDLPPGLPPGRYVLRIGLYDPATGRRLLRADGSNSLLLAGLPLGLADQGAVTASPAITRLADFEGGASLLGYDAGETQMRAGSTLSLTLIWQARTVVDRDYTVFVHLVGASASPVAQSDRQPLDGRYPTSIWNPGEVVVDVHTLAIPRDLRPGTYRLLVGLYHQPTNARAPTADGGDSVQIGEVRITSP